MGAPVTPSPTLRTALKEWAVLARAMGEGRITAMVRKGGIREQRAGFSVKHDRFLIYPTYFHEKESELAVRFRPLLGGETTDRPPEGMIRIEMLCEVVGLWRVDSLDRLAGIEHEHGLTPDAVASRFHYRNNPGVQVVAVRACRLPQAALIPEIRRYQGCVSWVALDEEIAMDGAVPVLGEDELQRRLHTITSALGQPASA